MCEYSIVVRDLKKKFRLYHDRANSLKEKVLFWNRSKYDELNVLKGISFSIKPGEVVGLMGHNGCGKSTTLKLLTGIMYPDSGKIEIKGRISSLLELGAGFHPDMSGRENIYINADITDTSLNENDNIYINASIFGLKKKEIDARLENIISFSELGEFINNPVRTYSSGMYMRLAFSVAINVNADVLLIDEILAVGDVNFQAKCFDKLMEIKNKGTTIVIVSHSTGQIEKFCNRAIWLNDGVIQKDGPSGEVCAAYMEFMQQQRNS